MTLCCASPDGCTLGTTGGNTIARVTGEGSTISGFRFIHLGGNGLGSNLEIVANGTHLIEDSSFENGQGGRGSNVFVQTFGNLTVRRSSFVNNGVGIHVDASKVVIEDSRFAGNAGAGLLLEWNSSLRDFTMGQDITVHNSSFINNGQQGIFATNLGTLPKLNIQLSTFEDNGNEAGSFCCPVDTTNYVFRVTGDPAMVLVVLPPAPISFSLTTASLLYIPGSPGPFTFFVN